MWDNHFWFKVCILNPSWHAKWAHVRWHWKTEVGLGHWENKEDGMKSAYQFWKNFSQNASASAEQR